MDRLNKTESAVFLYYRFSLFLKDPFSQINQQRLGTFKKNANFNGEQEKYALFMRGWNRK